MGSIKLIAAGLASFIAAPLAAAPMMETSATAQLRADAEITGNTAKADRGIGKSTAAKRALASDISRIEARENREFTVPKTKVAQGRKSKIPDDFLAGQVTEDMRSLPEDIEGTARYLKKRAQSFKLAGMNGGKPAPLLDGTGIGPQKPEYYRSRAARFTLDLGKK